MLNMKLFTSERVFHHWLFLLMTRPKGTGLPSTCVQFFWKIKISEIHFKHISYKMAQGSSGNGCLRIILQGEWIFFFAPENKKRNPKKMICKKASPKNGGVDDNFLFFKGMMFMEPFRIYLVYTCLTCQKKTNNTQGRELVGGFQIVLGVSPLGEMIQFEDDSSLTSIFRVCNMPLGGLLKVTPVKWYESFNLALVILAKKCIYIYIHLI